MDSRASHFCSICWTECHIQANGIGQQNRQKWLVYEYLASVCYWGTCLSVEWFPLLMFSWLTGCTSAGERCWGGGRCDRTAKLYKWMKESLYGCVEDVLRIKEKQRAGLDERKRHIVLSWCINQLLDFHDSYYNVNFHISLYVCLSLKYNSVKAKSCNKSTVCFRSSVIFAILEHHPLNNSICSTLKIVSFSLLWENINVCPWCAVTDY